VLAALQGIGLEEAQIQVQKRNDPTVPGGQGPRTVNRGGPLYRIQVGMPGQGGHIRTMEALAELMPGQLPPYRIRWKRYGLAVASPPSPPESDAARQ
jgi:general secretion pathway protein K